MVFLQVDPANLDRLLCAPEKRLANFCPVVRKKPNGLSFRRELRPCSIPAILAVCLRRIEPGIVIEADRLEVDLETRAPSRLPPTPIDAPERVRQGKLTGWMDDAFFRRAVSNEGDGRSPKHSITSSAG